MTRFTIPCAVAQNSRSQTAIKSVWSVSKLSTESVGSRRELVANRVHTADADASTVESRRRRRCDALAPVFKAYTRGVT